MVFPCSDYLKEVMKRVKEMSEQKQNTLHTNHRGGHFMFKLMKKRIKNEKGLTLVEVLAVVVILAIVAMIAIPAIGNMIENNRIKAMKADAINVISAAHIYYTEGNTATFTDSLQDVKNYLENFGSMTSFTVTEKGVLNGEATKGSVTLEFKDATVESIEAENPKETTTVKKK